MTMFSLVAAVVLFAQTPAPKPPVDPDDPGPPVVKRGGGAPRKAPAPTGAGPKIITPLPQEDGPAASGSPKADGPLPITDGSGLIAGPNSPGAYPESHPIVEKARQAVADLDSALPNFLCDEVVTRFESDAKPPKWKKKDLVEVDLMFVNGKEDYRNTRINGKPLKTGSPEDTGSWSTGDWATTLVDILHPATAAKFTRRGKDTIDGVPTEVFDLTVEKANSHWTIRYGKPIRPAYKGAIWIDPETGRGMRTEMQAVKLPNDYELDWVEQMTEFGWVKIGTEKYLLPVKSENIACWRYRTDCTRNVIEYKNYRKFSAESTISTTESEISFGDKVEEAKPVPAPPQKTAPKKKKD